jgi:hypothetical protein
MMEAETLFETLDYYAVLTRLIAGEDLIGFSRRESFKSYMKATKPENRRRKTKGTKRKERKRKI